MSRIGKRIIAIPDKVNVANSQGELTVKGPKGELKHVVSNLLSLDLRDKEIEVKKAVEHKDSGPAWGLTRTLIQNMVTGVSAGFTKKLEFSGVGYKAQVQGNKLVLNLGYSHPIEYKLPEGVSAKTAGNTIEISGCNKELVGFVAAKVRSFRPPEPYKGKGIKYADETILRKAGKTGAKK